MMTSRKMTLWTRRSRHARNCRFFLLHSLASAFEKSIWAFPRLVASTLTTSPSPVFGTKKTGFTTHRYSVGRSSPPCSLLRRFEYVIQKFAREPAQPRVLPPYVTIKYLPLAAGLDHSCTEIILPLHLKD